MKHTDCSTDKQMIEFCLIGRVVRAEVAACDSVRLTYSDGRTALLHGNNYGDTLAVEFDFPGTQTEALVFESGRDLGDETPERTKPAGVEAFAPLQILVERSLEFPEPSSADR